MPTGWEYLNKRKVMKQKKQWISTPDGVLPTPKKKERKRKQKKETKKQNKTRPWSTCLH